MMRQRTFILIKPDAVQRGIAFRLLSTLEETGLKLLGLRSVMLNDELLQGLYPTLVKKPFFGQVKAVMCCGPSIACVFEGHQAIEAGFSLAGRQRNPEMDETQSLRRRFALWTGADLIHRATNEDEAQAQIRLFFPDTQLHEYYKLGEEFTSQESWDEFGARWQ